MIKILVLLAVCFVAAHATFTADAATLCGRGSPSHCNCATADFKLGSYVKVAGEDTIYKVGVLRIACGDGDERTCGDENFETATATAMEPAVRLVAVPSWEQCVDAGNPHPHSYFAFSPRPRACKKQCL